jgi:SAM-dependent methyltransferase
MANIDYSRLFEGRFTATLSHVDRSLPERIYRRLSPSAFTELRLNELVDQYCTTHNPGPGRLRILDLGCGGGNEYLARFGRVTGVDVSRESVGNAKKIYDDALFMDVTKSISFQDNHFDIIYSSEVIGHIHADDKDTIYRECKRVLKDGGIFIGSIETFGENWITRKLKKYGLYEEIWINSWGHIGLERYEKTIERLRSYFSLKIHEPASTFVPSGDVVHELRAFGGIFKLFRKLAVRRVYNLLVFPLYRFSIRERFADQANNLVFVCVNRKNS